MPVEIPMDNRNESFEFSVALDEDVFRFSFRWNNRIENWTFDCFTEENEPIQTGNPYIVDVPLMFQNQSSLKPPGTLLAINHKDTQVNAGRYNIGGDVKLYYFTQEETTEVQDSGELSLAVTLPSGFSTVQTARIL
jgi:hypothetical protein